ncbi:hypothetical protein [Candidatus Magnetomonas plexicatena]|uniref:hypothetical protein n=1 Tax=Candidatus Magnetomonas plexicatena TaxID=2552947 RepID=UPI001103EB18|nr:hypothetical protein E2O03_011825 [Nitrospirales bacterium LBB_01]
MSSASNIKATKTVTFKSSCKSTGESIIVKADEDLNVDMSGNSKSSFTFGDKYYFRVYITSGISGYKITKSDGTVTANGTGKSVTVTESIKFENTDTASTSYPINSINSMTWYGTSLGKTKKSADMEITSESSGVAVAELRYESSYDSHYITVSQPSNYNTEEDAGYEVLIYVEEVP